MQVQLIYTGLDMNAGTPLPPEVFATYDETSAATQRDPALRAAVLATLQDGQPRVNGAWSTAAVEG